MVDPFPPSLPFVAEPSSEHSTNSRTLLPSHRDQNLSHITAGFLYSSASLAKVRVDQAYDGTLGSSLFDFTNVTADGLVLNSLWELNPAITSQPTCQQYQVNSDFPLVPADFLVGANAVFAGHRRDQFNGVVAEVSSVRAEGPGFSPPLKPRMCFTEDMCRWVLQWEIIYQGALPVTILVDAENTVVGYEYFSPVQRTRVVTNFFNVILGEMGAEVFDFPC